MTIKELKDRLSKYDDNMEIMILDGFNGGGGKRTINFGPCDGVIGDDPEDYEGADCDDRYGEKVVYMGYGCY